MSAFRKVTNRCLPISIYEYTAWSRLLPPLPVPTGGDRATENGTPMHQGPERLRRRLTGPGSFVKRGAATEARMEGKAACCFKQAMSSEASCLASPAP
jgi:hypothetical protein